MHTSVFELQRGRLVTTVLLGAMIAMSNPNDDPQRLESIGALKARLESSETREDALWELSSQPEVAVQLLPSLGKLLECGEASQFRRGLSNAFLAAGHHSLQTLQDRLTNPSVETRLLALEIIRAIAVSNPMTMEAISLGIVSLIDDADTTVAETALYALKDIGPNVNARVVETLLEYIQKPDSPLPNTALVVLSNLGAKAQSALPFLLRQLNSLESPLSRPLVIRALGVAGLESHPAHELLITRIEDRLRIDPKADETDVELESCLTAIGSVRIATPKAIRLLTQALLRPDPFEQVSAADSLTKLDPKNEAALAALIQLLSSKEQSCRLAAGYSLLEHENSLNALPTLRRLTKSPTTDESERQDYIELIQIIAKQKRAK